MKVAIMAGLFNALLFFFFDKKSLTICDYLNLFIFTMELAQNKFII